MFSKLFPFYIDPKSWKFVCHLIYIARVRLTKPFWSIRNSFHFTLAIWGWASPPQPLLTGTRCLQADLIFVYKTFKGKIDLRSSGLLLRPFRTGRHICRTLRGLSRLRRRNAAFSVRVVKYWNSLLASMIISSTALVFKKNSLAINTVESFLKSLFNNCFQALSRLTFLL